MTTGLLLVEDTVSRVGLDLPGGRTLVTVSTGDGSGLGSWTFEAPAGTSTMVIDWLGGEDMVSLESGGNTIEAVVRETRAEPAVRPLMKVAVESGDYRLVIPVKVICTEVLRRYYQSEEHQREYACEHPFIPAFHAERLKLLERLFRRYISPGERVLDVGSGYSIFYQIPVEWDFKVTCCDLDAAAMEKMRGLAPGWDWLVADACALPLEDSSFGAVYAGEIIEHVPDPSAALSEWCRVLVKGGVLILSTPNRERLLARSNRMEMPCHAEHVREFGLTELRDLLVAKGLEVLKETGIYLEIFENWWRPPGRRVDMLVARFSRDRHRLLYRWAMRLGRLWPSRAYDLVLVCRKL